MKSSVFSRSSGTFCRVILQGAFLSALFLGSISFAFATDPSPPTLTEVRVSSSNSNPALAKVGDTVTVFFTSSGSIDDTPVVSIGGTGAGITITRYDPPLTWKAERIITASDGAGLLAFSVDFTALGVPGATVTATTDSSSVTIDTTSPTAELSFSQSTVRTGDSLVITATMSEPILDSPVLALSLFGANTFATTTFTKTDSTHYTFTHTVGAGNGTTTVALGSATDMAGNTIVSAPTSGTGFFVDNIAPTITGARITGGNRIVVSYAEPITSTSTDYSALTLTPGGARTILGITASSSQSVTLSFDGAAVSVSATGTLAVGSGVRDSVGNQLVASTAILSDGQAPLAPGAPSLSSGGSLVGAEREASGFAVLVPLSASGAVSGDQMELLLNHAPFSSPLLHAITTADVLFGSAVFAVPHGQLGADGAKEITARLTDSLGNVGAEGGTLSLALDTVSPTLVSAKITGGNLLTLAYSEPVFSTTTDYSNFLATGGEARTLLSATGSSTATILLSFDGAALATNADGTIAIGDTVTDSAGNALVATTTVLADGQSPTASLSYSKSAAKAGDPLTITATLSEPILDSPVLALSLFGANTFATTTFTKTDSTHYTFTHTVGAGNGTTTVALGSATDMAGNTIVSAPTSGTGFFVDNIAPFASASLSRNPVKDGDITVISFVTSEPIEAGTPLLLSLGGANTLAATSTARADSTHFSFSYTAGTGDGEATIFVSGATDSAGNAIVAAPTAGATLTIDNTAPVITVLNPDSAPAHSKTLAASVSDGTVTQSITTGAVCNGTLSFGAYGSTTFSAEADNGKKICYRAEDSAGNVSFLFSDAIAGLDFTAPVISSLALSPSSGTRKVGDEIALTITADAAGYMLGFLSINGVATTSMVDAGGGRYFATTTVAEGNTDRVAGAVPVSAVLVDAAGNRNATSTAVFVNALAIDAHAPTLLSALTVSTTTIDFIFSEDLDGATVANADFVVEGAALASPDAFEVSPGIVRVALLSAQGTDATPRVSVTGMVQDLAGNVAPVAGPIIARDGVPPVISETTAVAAFTNDATPDYAFTASEAGAIGYGGDCASATATATSGPNALLFTALSDGLHSNCTIAVTDFAGNASNQVLVSPFTVDTIAPSVTVSTAAPNPTRTSPIPFIATFSEPVIGFESSDISVSNGTVGNFSAASSAVYTFAVTPASDTTVTVGVASEQAADSAGNGNSAAQDVARAFDSTPPVITIAPYTSAQTNQDITVNASVNEGTLNASSRLFTANGSFDFVATDAAGNSATSTVTIGNIDKAAPVIAAPAAVTVEATSTSGALGIYTLPSAMDALDGAAIVSCAPLSGTRFALGETEVSCTSADRAGNIATATFLVNVVDTTAPAIAVPQEQTFEATAPLTPLAAPVLVLASATDAVSTTTVSLTYSPTSFPVGTTIVTWTAQDGAGNRATATSSVRIVDTTAPVISLPDTVSAPAESAAGATITYAPPTATDLGSGSVGVLCSPSSGAVFALGTTTVLCSAVDAKQNIATSSFAVVVMREISLAGTVSVNAGAPDIVVRSGTAATSTITVPAGVASSRLNLAALLVSGTSTRQASIGGAVMVSALTTNGSISLALPPALSISGGSSWDGAFLLPRTAAASPTPPTPSPGMSAAVSQVIEVGGENAELTLSRAARLLLPGAAELLVGSTRSGSAFTPITQVCVSDEQSAVDAQLGIGTSAACRLPVGADLAVWTNHFTSFVTYTESPLPLPPPFLGGNGPIMASSPRGARNYGVPVSTAAPSPISISLPEISAAAPLSGVVAPAPSAARAAAPPSVSKTVATGGGRGGGIAPLAKAAAGGSEASKKEILSATSSELLAAGAASLEPGGGAFTRIKKGWSAFIQKIRALRR